MIFAYNDKGDIICHIFSEKWYGVKLDTDTIVVPATEQRLGREVVQHTDDEMFALFGGKCVPIVNDYVEKTYGVRTQYTGKR